MSTVKTKNVQIGADGTASNNFTIYQPSTPDGTSRWAVGVSGATTADVVTVNSSGNVGIGTTSPSTKLHVYNAGDVTSTIGSNTGASILNLASNSNSSGAYNAIISNTASGENWYIGGLGNSNSLSFRTNGGNERMRIDSSGNVLINTTSNIALSGRTVPLQILQNNNANEAITIKANSSTYTFSSINFVNASNSQVGFIYMSATATQYSTSSDYRLKENIVPMTGALDKVALLKPVTYTWKVDGSDGQGFIAHELAEVIPDAVSGEKDAVNEDGSIKAQGVDTSFLVATLTAAIQELTKRVQELEAKVN